MSSPDATTHWRYLAWAALFTWVVHLLAGLAMAVVLRQGLDSEVDLEKRLRFLDDQSVPWVLGWLLWNLAALSILYFYHCFARVLEALDATNPLPRFAVYVSAAAIALDLAAEAIEMGLLPQLARQALAAHLHVEKVEVFTSWHRAAVLLTGLVANGLYTASALILAWCGRGLFPRWISIASIGVGGGGFGLSLAALLDWVDGMVVANVVLLPSLLLWLAGVRNTARRAPQQLESPVHFT